jgi:hypothetical protein
VRRICEQGQQITIVFYDQKVQGLHRLCLGAVASSNPWAASAHAEAREKWRKRRGRAGAAARVFHA